MERNRRLLQEYGLTDRAQQPKTNQPQAHERNPYHLDLSALQNQSVFFKYASSIIQIAHEETSLSTDKEVMIQKPHNESYFLVESGHQTLENVEKIITSRTESKFYNNHLRFIPAKVQPCLQTDRRQQKLEQLAGEFSRTIERMVSERVHYAMKILKNNQQKYTDTLKSVRQLKKMSLNSSFSESTAVMDDLNYRKGKNTHKNMHNFEEGANRIKGFLQFKVFMLQSVALGDISAEAKRVQEYYSRENIRRDKNNANCKADKTYQAGKNNYYLPSKNQKVDINRQTSGNQLAFRNQQAFYSNQNERNQNHSNQNNNNGNDKKNNGNSQSRFLSSRTLNDQFFRDALLFHNKNLDESESLAYTSDHYTELSNKELTLTTPQKLNRSQQQNIFEFSPKKQSHQTNQYNEYNNQQNQFGKSPFSPQFPLLQQDTCISFNENLKRRPREILLVSEASSILLRSSDRRRHLQIRTNLFELPLLSETDLLDDRKGAFRDLALVPDLLMESEPSELNMGELMANKDKFVSNQQSSKRQRQEHNRQKEDRQQQERQQEKRQQRNRQQQNTIENRKPTYSFGISVSPPLIRQNTKQTNKLQNYYFPTQQQQQQQINGLNTQKTLLVAGLGKNKEITARQYRMAKQQQIAKQYLVKQQQNRVKQQQQQSVKSQVFRFEQSLVNGVIIGEHGLNINRCINDKLRLNSFIKSEQKQCIQSGNKIRKQQIDAPKDLTHNYYQINNLNKINANQHANNNEFTNTNTNANKIIFPIAQQTLTHSSSHKKISFYQQHSPAKQTFPSPVKHIYPLPVNKHILPSVAHILTSNKADYYPQTQKRNQNPGFKKYSQTQRNNKYPPVSPKINLNSPKMNNLNFPKTNLNSANINTLNSPMKSPLKSNQPIYHLQSAQSATSNLQRQCSSPSLAYNHNALDNENFHNYHAQNQQQSYTQNHTKYPQDAYNLQQNRFTPVQSQAVMTQQLNNYYTANQSPQPSILTQPRNVFMDSSRKRPVKCLSIQNNRQQIVSQCSPQLARQQPFNSQQLNRQQLARQFHRQPREDSNPHSNNMSRNSSKISRPKSMNQKIHLTLKREKQAVF